MAMHDAGKIIPAQVSVLSTYPSSEQDFPVGRPEVVQLATRTNLPAKPTLIGHTDFGAVEPFAAQLGLPADWTPEGNALLVAQNVAEQLLKRVTFRRAMKRAVSLIRAIRTKKAGPELGNLR